MRYKTQVLNIQDYIDMLSSEALNEFNDQDEPEQYIQFDYDFPDLANENGSLEPSDSDISIMIELHLKGMDSGEQEFWWFDDQDVEHSSRLTWTLNP